MEQLQALPGCCWCLVVDSLAARDLAALCCTSASLQRLLATPGLWTHAARRLLGWEPRLGSSSSSSSAQQLQQQPHPRSDDAAAARALMHMAAVGAITGRMVPRCRPQTFVLPPWLAQQPGSARGFVRVDDPGGLSPPLQLSAAQASWLALGCLAGHAGGVFVSAVSHNPRSRAPASMLAAVVLQKQLVAEIYLQHGSSAGSGSRSAAAAHGRWSGLLTGCDASASAAPVHAELWLSQAVSLAAAEPAQQQPDGSGGSMRRRRRGGGSGAAAAGPPRWPQVHALLMGCVHDNAARSLAVRGTTFVPPGSAAAAALGPRLLQLAAAGAPLLDLRAAAMAVSARPVDSGDASSVAGVQAAAARLCVSGAAAAAAAAGEASAAGALAGSSRGQQWWQLPHAAVGGAQPWHDQQAAVRAALSSAVAAKQAEAAAADAGLSSSSSSSNGVDGRQQHQQQPLSDDAMAEVLGALLARLPMLAPSVQLLVLPLMLPRGRVGVKLSAGGSRLSAPRLLSLNVPLLVPLRAAWEGLPALRHVLLMAGPQPGSDHTQQQQQERRGVFSSQHLEAQWAAEAAQEPQRLTAAQTAAVLPQYALEAVAGMLQSCMDR